MMISHLIKKNYDEYIINKVIDDELCIYRSLIKKLFSIEYKYNTINKDRHDDVIEYRKNYLIDNKINQTDILDKYKVNVLEVLIVLSIRTEDDTMHDIKYGDRSCQWFWAIISDIGLIKFDDNNYNESEVEKIVFNWMSIKKPLWTQMTDILYRHNYFEGG